MPHAELYSPEELQAKHRAFWNKLTIQRFWSGQSFLQSGIGNLLSYDLAFHIVGLAARESTPFRRFAVSATRADAGSAAAMAQLGYPLPNLVEAVLGPGSWEPRPGEWPDGERADTRVK